MTTLYNEDVFPKGKHQGKKVAVVIKEDPLYIRMFNKLFNNICVSDDTVKETYAR